MSPSFIFTIVDGIRTYIKYVLFHKWNKVSKDQFKLMDEVYWGNKPTKGFKYWVYTRVKIKNNIP